MKQGRPQKETMMLIGWIIILFITLAYGIYILSGCAADNPPPLPEGIVIITTIEEDGSEETRKMVPSNIIHPKNSLCGEIRGKPLCDLRSGEYGLIILDDSCGFIGITQMSEYLYNVFCLSIPHDRHIYPPIDLQWE